MKELVLVFKLLNICADRVEEQPIYEQPIIELLQICSLPFLKEKSSDEMVYEQIVVESVSQLGNYFTHFVCSYFLCGGTICSFKVRAFAHGVMGCRIDPLW